MSEYIKHIKDPDTRAYLEYLKAKNKAYMSICHYCKDKAIGVISEGYILYPACFRRTAIFDSLRENKELLEKIGSDYDENGIPYWEKS